MLRKLLLPVVAVALLVANACSSLDDPAALTVNGTEISGESVDAELQELQDNAAYREFTETDCGGPAQGEGAGTFDSACIARILSLRAYGELIEQELAERGGEVTEDDLLEARERGEQRLVNAEGESLLDQFSEELQDRTVRLDALLAALDEAVATEGGAGEEEQRAFYEQNIAQFEQACASHILASTEAQSSEEARARVDAIAARIAGGEDFATIATNENDDPGAAQSAGSLDCGPRGRFVPAFDEQVFSLPLNELSAPVETEFGWHLILVTSRETQPFEEVQPQIAEFLSQQGSTALRDVLIEMTCEADVTVDPKFGEWDDDDCGSEQVADLARVVPPEGPVSTETTISPLP